MIRVAPFDSLLVLLSVALGFFFAARQAVMSQASLFGM